MNIFWKNTNLYVKKLSSFFRKIIKVCLNKNGNQVTTSLSSLLRVALLREHNYCSITI